MAIRTNRECETQQLLQHDLLDEFEQYKALHKYAILKAKAVKYFEDLENDSITIPHFLCPAQTPEAKADAQIRNLLCIPDGGRTFNRLYETAYQELAEVLD